MAAFEKTKSGIPMMDDALQNIRLGDNVVWQVPSLDEFRYVAERFSNQAIADGRNLIYIRFAEHEPILTPREGLRIEHVELSHRFETFTVNIHNLIEREGYDTFYIFDCLSELEQAWSTDLMMGNFFHLTCPYLFILDTVAYFPLIRGRHSFDAIATIRDTTQLFLDVYKDEKDVFVRPMKVWNRYSQTMFQPYRLSREDNSFTVLRDGTEVSHFYSVMNKEATQAQDQNVDSWERFFFRTKLLHQNGVAVTEDCSKICNIMLTRDSKMRELIKSNFTPEDYFEVHSRMVGTGMIGGKACGMLLSRKIVENHRPDIFERFEPHDSYYIGSDVFYAYIVDNGFWDLRIKQRTEEGYFTLAGEFEKKIMEGKFPTGIEAEFRRILDYYGNDPVIVRSSSILEDGFGNAFAGKYESVFCGNQGDPEERLQKFEEAVKIVYASTMSMSALDYRKRRGLDKRDEQMAILVQRVSGSRYEGFFMPCTAGVGYSVSPYRMGSEKPKSGMLRLVMGLGTAAVDRRTGSYPRLVSLDAPTKVLSTDMSDRQQFSQRIVDAISADTNDVEGFDAMNICKSVPRYLKNMIYSHNYETESRLRERGDWRDVLFITCDGLTKNEQLMTDMRDILELIQTHYEYPVDTEYTINFAPDGSYVIDLLQCRPLQLTAEGDKITVPDGVDNRRILLETKGVSMGFSREIAIDGVVYIDPILYYQMPYRRKYEIKEALSQVNWRFRNQGKHLLLLTPGRICTSSPELGVPSGFSDISEFSVIAEVSESKVGYIPELSYGSHIFQDLVEAGILYTAVFEKESTIAFSPDLLKEFADVTNGVTELADDIKGVLRVYDTSKDHLTLYYDLGEEHLLVCKE
ncbi:PEP/pyruvate-binding domain-containing protein [Ruminococcus difficilis]|uniref:Phosphoenolpyruvate synthase n=1 Tax=Ruminococcus difficilis TaxID=2763069 RepID=A0A935C3C6_9FIRM|nr:PEP/pyruvate-binding domain-containing protein [Ruminococcus difficilis]MBK6089686.1 phosphoenolpyruvate synthase [Ruminococcus difficilis]